MLRDEKLRIEKEDFSYQIDWVVLREEKRHFLFEKLTKELMQAAQVTRRVGDGGLAWDRKILDKGLIGALVIGRKMEETAALINKVNSEVQESKKTLETIKNEVCALAEVIQPELVRHIQDLRSSRMAAITETREMLNCLRDIRKFFLESDYSLELERLERFVSVCKELKVLKQSGVLDAVCDSAIRLAIGEDK